MSTLLRFLRRHAPAHVHDWGMVPVRGGFTFMGLREHRAECLSCGQRPDPGTPEHDQAELNHNRAVNAMLEARGE